MEYKDYLNSDKWKKQRKKTLSFYGRKCAVCGKKKVDIHHKTYKRIFNEKVSTDLIPVCRKHHELIHIFAKESHLNIYTATERYISANRTKKPKKLLWSQMTRSEKRRLLG